MKKQHIIFVAVVIALWGGFMVYRHLKHKGDAEEHATVESTRITKAARKSPRAGLAQMGSALKKYYDDNNNTYPPTLNELHPKYIGNKSFIDDLDWYYTRQGDNFFLSKTVVRDNKRMVASVDKSLMPRVETGVMVATPGPIPEAVEVERPEAPITGVPKVSIQSREEFWEALRQRELDGAAQPLPKKRTSAILLARRPKIISVVESEVVSEAESEVSQRYLVWKDNKGTLGFGDAQFPATKSRTIYDEGNWYDMAIPMPKEMGSVSSDIEPVSTEVDPGVIVSNIGKRYLVWKGEQGTLGFGNVEYPEKDRISVFTEEDWVSVERPTSVVSTVGEKEYAASEEEMSESVASKLSTEYLVWKDQETLGFGNVVYPQAGQVSAYQEGEWIGVERPALPPGTASEKEYAPPEEPSPETVTSKFSTRYLVWKDEQGNLGFGNVVYPQAGQVSAYQEDEWIGVERPALPPRTASGKEYAPLEEPSPETVTSELSTRYLVWKDEHGNLGFGNVVYPGTENVSYVHEDGNWKEIMN
ncbi:MAG: hypothetical protein JRF69_13330 [Deltaproteobacteria bacterium]|nr:hypothetical protein [Deltaproteobacteria bacterium]